MGFLFAIPSFIFHLVSNLLSWVFSLIGGILGIVIWPFKLVWGLIMGVGKLLISVILAPFLLFSHPAEISAAQPVVGTIPTIPNNRIEQIFNEIQRLELAGSREMEPLRNNEKSGQCVTRMRENQAQADNLVEITNTLPMQYNALGAAAISLNSCVSCQSSAQTYCEIVRMNLNDYQLKMSEE